MQMMAQQLANQEQMNNTLNLQISNQSKPILNVNFRISSSDYQIVIQCYPDEKVSDIIERYRYRICDFDKTKKFTFNSKNLKEKENLSLSEVGIIDNSDIFVNSTK